MPTIFIQKTAYDGRNWGPLLPMTHGCVIEAAANENWKFILSHYNAPRCQKTAGGGAQCTLVEAHQGVLHVCVANEKLYARWTEVP